MFNTHILTCALIVAGVLFIGNQARAQVDPGPPSGLNVNVVNTPLPVTVTNPTVPPSTVNVGNPAALAAANAQALTGTPVVFQLGPTYSVPLGKRLMIEYVSGICNNTPGLSGSFFPIIEFVTSGFQNIHFFTVPVVNPQPAQVPFGLLVKIFADGGTNVHNNNPGCTINVSAQLVTP